jgi:ectoine hydroxylase-related dioxygenase (phytanoyl-CoA dioxygenase family)
MNSRELYMFDLQGFLVVKNFLTPTEVEAMNAAFDANRHQITTDGNSSIGKSKSLGGTHRRGMFSEMLTWPHPHCDPFRTLLAHPKAIPYLNALFGRGWRMDHSPFMLECDVGSEGLILHSGGHHWDGVQYQVFKNGQVRCGMVVFQYQLADVNEGDGGFCCIPGSQKANLAPPQDILEWDANRELVYNVPCKAGDLLIFNEATTHGTIPWRGKHKRRSLLYRYSPRSLHFAGGYHHTTFPDWVTELTEAQRAVLEPPYIYNRPLIEPDGKTIVRPLREG